MKNYTNVTMITGPLERRWYISYNFKSPVTGKFERHREYGGVNRCDSVKSRMAALTQLMHARQQLLDMGWSPFEEFNLDKILDPVEALKPAEAIDRVLENKKLYLKPTSHCSLANRAEFFKRFLVDNGYSNLNVADIKRKHILAFLDERLASGISNRSRNNLLVDMSAIFSKMVEMELVSTNPCSGIKKIPYLTHKNKPFHKDQLTQINEWMAENDPNLHMFCRFIAYGFMRPIEIVKLRVRDIRLHEGIIQLPSEIVKTGMEQTKPILDIFRPHLESLELEKYPGDYYVFSTKGHPDSVPTTRDYFTAKFKVLKDALRISENQTMYAIRHTVLSDLLRNGVDPLHLKKYTGHKTWAGFDAYIKSIDTDVPKDISERYSLSI